MPWNAVYRFMLCLPSSGRKLLWWVLRKTHLIDLFCDEGYFKIKLLGATGERFSSAEDGGGINSLLLAQELFWRSDLPKVCCDKFAVREYVRSRGFGDILVPLVPSETMWRSSWEIPFESLPGEFVLKCNNGSGLLRIVRDKTSLKLDEIRGEVDAWLKSDFGVCQRERQYVGMTNCVFAERLIKTGGEGVPPDYKIMCSNGRPLYAWVDTGRFVRHLRTVFDTDFNRLDVSIGFPVCQEVIEKPQNWDRMLEIASGLSAGIPIVRIDLYNVGGRIYFGEMTFTSDRANAITRPFEFSNRMARRADPICRPFRAEDAAYAGGSKTK